MMLIEETVIADANLPLEEFKAHLRLGTGFSDDGTQDQILLSFLRASLSAVEARTGKALFERGFLWSLSLKRLICATLAVLTAQLAILTTVVAFIKQEPSLRSK